MITGLRKNEFWERFSIMNNAVFQKAMVNVRIYLV